MEYLPEFSGYKVLRSSSPVPHFNGTLRLYILPKGASVEGEIPPSPTHAQGDLGWLPFQEVQCEVESLILLFQMLRFIPRPFNGQCVHPIAEQGSSWLVEPVYIIRHVQLKGMFKHKLHAIWVNVSPQYTPSSFSFAVQDLDVGVQKCQELCSCSSPPHFSPSLSADIHAFLWMEEQGSDTIGLLSPHFAAPPQHICSQRWQSPKTLAWRCERKESAD